MCTYVYTYVGMEGVSRDIDQNEVLLVERRIQKRFPIGASVSERVILDDFAAKVCFS